MIDNIEFFDIVSYFEDKDISYWTEGDNVTRGWVNIQCPFCGDPKNHLGISPTRFCNCWICGPKGYADELVAYLEGGVSIAQANSIIETYIDYTLVPDIKESVRHVKQFRDILPKEASDQFPKIHIDYLKGRGFDPQKVIKEYKLKATHLFGDWKFRIIIPIFLDNKVVQFTSRDVTDKSPVPYLHCPDEEALIDIKSIVYGIEGIKKDMLVVEGAVDKWKADPGAIATLGIIVTSDQMKHLMFRGVERAFVWFDPESEAQERARKVAYNLSAIIPYVERIEFGEGDPGSLSFDTIRGIKEEIGFREN